MGVRAIGSEGRADVMAGDAHIRPVLVGIVCEVRALLRPSQRAALTPGGATKPFR